MYIVCNKTICDLKYLNYFSFAKPFLMYLFRSLLFFTLLICCFAAYSQQDMDLHLNETFLTGKNILKVKRDFHDPYLWVLAQNNEVYRINSITKQVDNFTGTFSRYNNYHFIDIAGVSMDTVYVATNNKYVIQSIAGSVSLIGAKGEIPGTVNSIGVDQAGANNGYSQNDHTLLIATNHGVCRYNVKSHAVLPIPKDSPSRIFEATYRTEMLTDGEFCRCYPDTVDFIPAIELINYTIYSGELWTGGNSFGHTIKSAFYTAGNAYDAGYEFTLFSNQFWATENGLFENYWSYSYSTGFGYEHYLKGANISKITSIYGLYSFGDGVVRENLLVGSAQGLYFSNSKYPGGPTPKYSFFHYSGLGNKAINDICVNALSYTKPECEDGIWIAAVDGLYLLKPDYGPYINSTQKLNVIHFDGQDYNTNDLQLCANVSAKAVIQGYMGNVIQWYKNGQEIPNESSTSLNITQPGDYNAILYDPCSAVHFETNHLKVTQIAAPVFTFNYPDNLNYCDGSTATLKTEDKLNYQYRWYKDGVLNGSTTASLDITENGKYKVEVSACSGNWVASKQVQVNFIKVPKPVIKTDKQAYCVGDNAKLSAIVPIDASNIINWQPYQYRWYTNDVLNGNASDSFTVSEPGKYSVEVTSCSGDWVASEDRQVDFISLTKPIIVADKPAYCIGDGAMLSSGFTNDGTYTIKWFRDGNIINADQNKSVITAGQDGNYTVSISNNLTACSQASDKFMLKFDTPPDISIQQIINTTLCDGETVKLKASYSGGSIKWSTGGTSDQIDVNQSGLYSATITTPGGCMVTKENNVQFFHNPVLTVPDATLCQFTNEAITLTAPDGFVKYEWNGQVGSSIFSTGSLGKVSLTVTDHNGCKASQVINISSHCKDIHIPNTFTPNGDGINDTWVISGLDNDLSVAVKTFDRYGSLLFQSIGYATPWDGTYRGKKLPAGVYYYVISARAKQVLSGSVTIIY